MLGYVHFWITTGTLDALLFLLKKMIPLLNSMKIYCSHFQVLFQNSRILNFQFFTSSFIVSILPIQEENREILEIHRLCKQNFVVQESIVFLAFHLQKIPQTILSINLSSECLHPSYSRGTSLLHFLLYLNGEASLSLLACFEVQLGPLTLFSSLELERNS